MKVIIQSENSLRKVGNAIVAGGLSVIIESKKLELELLTIEDIDIVIAYLSRLLFTITFHNFELENDLNSSLSNLAKKDFSGAIYIRQKLLSFFRNNNQVLDIEKFIKYNLPYINNFYDEILRGISTESIINKIQNYFVSNNQEIKKIAMRINFISGLSEDNFFIQLMDDTHNSIMGSYDSFSYQLIMPTLKSHKNAKVKITGAYNLETVNMLYEKCIEFGCQNIDFIL